MGKVNTLYGEVCPDCGTDERFSVTKKCVHCYYQSLSRQFMGRKGVGNAGKQKENYKVPSTPLVSKNGALVKYD